MSKVRVAEEPEKDSAVLPYPYTGKLVRKAAYEEIRATFSAIHGASGKSLSDFRLPASWFVGPISPEERRVKAPGQNGFSISTSNGDTSIKPQLLADAKAADVNMVVFMKGQGSVGCGGAYYLLAQGYTVESSWDWFHRVKNDIFLAATRSGGGAGKVYRTMLEMCMVMGISYVQPVRLW